MIANPIVPKKVFLTKGLGRDQDKLIAFEYALRSARIQQFNLVPVSSIIPPNCEVVSIDDGLKELKEGQILFCVLSKKESSVLNQNVSASISMALPKDPNKYGYVAENGFDCESEEIADRCVEKLALVLLATKLGIEVDRTMPHAELKKQFLNNELVKDLKSASAQGVVEKENEWTCAISAAVFVY
ncbi:MAG: pyruvoyl-dependent arginine decarboxylase [Candidatus Hodarchaeota archaeon]